MTASRDSSEGSDGSGPVRAQGLRALAANPLTTVLAQTLRIPEPPKLKKTVKLGPEVWPLREALKTPRTKKP